MIKTKYGERNDEIKRLRAEELMTLQAIGDIYGLTHERIRQIVGKRGNGVLSKRMEADRKRILAVPIGLTYAEVAKRANVKENRVRDVYEQEGIRGEQRNEAVIKKRKEDFFSLIKKKRNGCHIWTGWVHPVTGYGVFSFHKLTKDRYTHRLAWIFANGEIPDGLHVLHTCDTPACVNPDHLFLGTMRDNIADRDAKGRQARGERSGLSKLTKKQVLAARKMKKENPEMKTNDIIIRLGLPVSQDCLRLAIIGRTWKHLPGAIEV